MSGAPVKPKIVVVHSRKGGVGKTTISMELAYALDAVLLDLDWEEGGASAAWGYRWQDRHRSPLLDAVERGTIPRPLRGHNKADLVPSHPDFEQIQPDPDTMADLVTSWAGEWGREWVVIDTHPGSTSATAGVLAVANIVVAPVPLAVKDLAGTAALVRDLADYPLVLVVNKVPPSPPESLVKQLRSIVTGTPVQVADALIPRAVDVERRRKRMAILSEKPPAKALQPVAAAMQHLTDYIKEYVK